MSIYTNINKFFKRLIIIETYGICCSILLLRKDKVGKRIIVNKNPTKEKYIDEIKNYSEISDKNIVAIDPSKMDLLFCVDNFHQRCIPSVA